MTHDVFISYSSIDKVTADAICHTLEKNNIRCWIAPRDILAGEKYSSVIKMAIESCQVCLLIYSDNSKRSAWCESELNIAFSSNRTIIPFKIDESTLDGEMKLMLNNRHWIDAYQDPDTSFKNLVTSINNLLDRQSAPEGQIHEAELKLKLRGSKSRSRNMIIVAAIAAVVLIAAALIVILGSGGGKTEEIATNICIELAMAPSTNIRSYGIGRSANMNIALSKAEVDGRARMAASMKSSLEVSATNSIEVGDTSTKELFQELTVHSVSEVLREVKTIKNSIFRLSDGSYEVYVCMEMSYTKEQVMANMYNIYLHAAPGETAIDKDSFDALVSDGLDNIHNFLSASEE